MRENFERSLQRVLVHEGGHVNHPRDPGGATNFGVTQRVYDGYRENRHLEKRSVRKITKDEVRDICRNLYARKIRFDDLPAGVDYCVLDGAFNSGVMQSAKWLQRAAGCARVDGNIDEATIAAVRAHADHDLLIAKILSLRLGMLQKLKTYNTFGKGWRIRVADVLHGAQAWASGSVPTKAEAKAAELGGNQKANPDAYPDDIAAPQHETAAEGAAGGGTFGGGIIETTRQHLEPLAWSGGEWIQNILLGLVVLSLLIAAGGFAYRWWSKKERAKIAKAMNAQTYVDVYEIEEVQEHAVSN